MSDQRLNNWSFFTANGNFFLHLNLIIIFMIECSDSVTKQQIKLLRWGNEFRMDSQEGAKGLLAYD